MNKERVKELLTDIDIDVDIDDITTIDELDEAVQEYIGEENIIYYTNAIKYLAENDPSLSTALELAADMGYEAKDLNSELLASILLQQNMNEDYQERRDTIEELFNY